MTRTEHHSLLRRGSIDVCGLLAVALLTLRCGGAAHSDTSASGGSVSSSGGNAVGGAPAGFGGSSEGGVTIAGGSTAGGVLGGGASGAAAGGVSAGGLSVAQGGSVPGAGGYWGVAGSISLAGAASEGGAAGAPNACDGAELWRAIVEGAVGGLGTCESSSVPSAGEKVGRTRGAVVIDANGRVIDNTGLMGAEKQEWLDNLSGKLWPCYAGETLGYKCKAAG